MSWFTDFLTDTARQAAPGIHQGINTDIQRKQRLDEMQKQIPIEVERQKALMPGELEKVNAQNDAATRRALMVEALRNQMRGPKTHVVGGRLVGDQGNVLYEPPPAQPTQGEKLMSRVLGPLGSSTQESPVASGPGAGTPQKPAALPPGMSVTSGGVTLRAPGAEQNAWDEYNEPGTGRRMRYNKQTGERTEVSGAVKTAQPFTPEIQALNSVASPNNPLFQPEFANWKPGETPTPAHSYAAMQYGRVNIPTQRAGSVVGAQLDARAEHAQQIYEVKKMEELAKRDPSIIAADLAKMERVQQITLKYAPEIEKARGLSRPMGESAQTQMRLFENTLRSLDNMRREFSEADLLRYAGIWNRGENYIAQVAGVDRKFQQFLVMNEHLRSTAFQYGGKQLTPFEASVVFGFTPHGREIFKEQYLEKMNQLEERTHFELGRVRYLATTPKAAVVPAVPPGTKERLGGENTPSTKHRLSGTKTNKPDGQYPLKDGTTITVKGGVVQ